MFHLLAASFNVTEAEKISGELGHQHFGGGAGGVDHAQSHYLPREFSVFDFCVVAAGRAQFRAEAGADVYRGAVAVVHAGVVHVRDQCVAALFRGVFAAPIFSGGYVLVGVQGGVDHQHCFGGAEFFDGDGQYASAGAAGRAAAEGFGAGRERAGD